MASVGSRCGERSAICVRRAARTAAGARHDRACAQAAADAGLIVGVLGIDGRARPHGRAPILSRDDQPHAPAIRDRLDAASLIRFGRLLENDGLPMTLETLWFDAARFQRLLHRLQPGNTFFAALRETAVSCRAMRAADRCRLRRCGRTHILGVTASQPVYRIEKDRDRCGPPSARALAACHAVPPGHLYNHVLKGTNRCSFSTPQPFIRASWPFLIEALRRLTSGGVRRAMSLSSRTRLARGTAMFVTLPGWAPGGPIVVKMVGVFSAERLAEPAAARRSGTGGVV